MLVPPVAQGGTGDRPVGDTVARGPQTTTGTAAATTTLWPLAPAQPNQVPNQQAHGIPPLAATPAPAHNQGSHCIIYVYVCVRGWVQLLLLSRDGVTIRKLNSERILTYVRGVDDTLFHLYFYL